MEAHSSELEGANAVALLQKYESARTTVWFIEKPNASVEARWQGQVIYESLRQATVPVRDDLGNHLGYDVIAHGSDGDRTVTQRELADLVAAAAS